MKQTLSLLLLSIGILLQHNIYAQQNNRVSQNSPIANAKQFRWDYGDDFPKFIEFKSTASLNASNIESWIKTYLSPIQGASLQQIARSTDPLGLEHLTFQYVYSGYPIEGFEVKIHSINAGVQSLNTDVKKIKNIHTTISVPEAVALDKALTVFKSSKFIWDEPNNPTKKPVAELVLIATNNKAQSGDFRLCYKFEIYSLEPLQKELVYVDARDNTIIFRENKICHIDYDGTAHTRYSGIQTIKTSLSGTNYVLRQGSRGGGINTFNMQNGSSYSSAVNFTDADNIWNNVNAAQDEIATDAHFGTEKTYDYFFNMFGRNSYNNAGAPINSYVHYGSNYNNAFWDGSRMTYGDGDGVYFTPLVSLDVIGHEITHGVTEYAADLVYSYESGALNESFSDIFGKCIELYAVSTTTSWLIGDRITPSGRGIRSMDNPNMHGDPDTYNGTNWFTGSGDNGGVHINSGVQNHWFYLLVTGGSGTNDLGASYSISGIGLDKAARIAYRNLSVYLTRNSNYADARYYSVIAAQDLYGSCSAEVIAVANAWYAVGVGSAPNYSVQALFSANRTYACATPVTIQFNNTSLNATSYRWNFGDGTTSTQANPSKTYTSSSTFTVTLTATGSGSCSSGSNTMIRSNYITVDNIGGPITATCSPQTSIGSSNYGIIRFALGNINNTSQPSTEGYRDFTCTNSTQLLIGKKYTIEVQTGNTGTENVRVWLDSDNNGVFASTELLYSSTNFGTHVGQILIPNTTVRNTPIRLRVGSNFSSTVFPDGCSSISNGQYEDYTVLLSLPGVSAPVADFNATPTFAQPGATIQFQDYSENLPTAYQWRFEGGSPLTSTSQNPTVTYASEGLFAVTLTSSNAAGSNRRIKTGYILISNSVNMCGTTTTFTSPNGKVFDSGGPNGMYQNSENCTLLINPPCANSLTIRFRSFDTESGYDYLSIYNGTSTSAPLVFYRSGSSLPDSVVLSSGKAFVTFYSDGSVVRNGFEFDYYSRFSSGTPVANFLISNTNPGISIPVQFTNTSNSEARISTWDFGGGNRFTSTNASFVYTTPGVKQVKLIVSNCTRADSITKTLLVQQAGTVSIIPTQIDAVLPAGDSTTRTITLTNSGLGDVAYSFTNLSVGYASSSFIPYYSTGAQTIHTFTGLPASAQTLVLRVTLNGDYDSFSENATLYINDALIETIPDGDVYNGLDIVKSYTFTGAQLNTWLSQGLLRVRLANSFEVNTGIGGTDSHRVVVSITGSNTFVSLVSTLTAIVRPSQAAVSTLKLKADRNAGIYRYPIIISTTDPTKPLVTVSCNLTILGNPLANFIANKTQAGSNELIQFTDLSLNTPTGWNWTFTGGNPAFSSVQNPTVSYPASGVYPVHLRVSNTFGTSILSRQNYINISDDYTMCSVSGTTASSGRIFDSGGPFGAYQNNQYCTFLINPNCFAPISLTFQSISLENCCDYIRVYNGSTTSAPIIYTSNGSLPTSAIVASSGMMLITFSTDGSVVSSGFEASWTTGLTSSPPIADFSFSPSNPSQGEVVSFQNLSTNSGSAIWQVDGMVFNSINLNYAFQSPGTRVVTLTAINCLTTTSISKVLSVTGPPIVHIQPTNFNITLAAGDSSLQYISITNSGVGALAYTIAGTNSQNSVKNSEVLLLTYGVDASGELVNTINAIRQFIPSFTGVLLNSVNPTTVQGALFGKRIVIIPEIETASSTDYLPLASILQDFVSRGGSVVACGNYSGLSPLEVLGLMSTTGTMSYVDGQTMQIASASHPICNGVTSFTAPNGTYARQITNANKIQLVRTSSNLDVVSIRNIGLGNVAFIAFDYYSNGTNEARLLANTLNFVNNSGLPTWLIPRPLIGRVPGVTNTTTGLLFNTTGLSMGTYTASINFVDNDQLNPTIPIQCTLNVLGNPITDFIAFNTLVGVGQMVNFVDLSINTPTGWNWTFTGASPSSSSTKNPSVAYTATGLYTVGLTTNNAFGTSTRIKQSYINVVNGAMMCSNTISGASGGKLFDSGGPSGNYGDNQTCSFIIQPTCAGSITLTFQSFDIDYSDYIYIYNGTTSSAALVYYGAGTTIPNPITVNTGIMMIFFYTNSSVNRPGFEATWSSVPLTSVPSVYAYASNTNPSEGQSVSFYQTISNATSFQWNFGNGRTSTFLNPSTTYTTAGIYVATLTAVNCIGSTSYFIPITVSGISVTGITPNPCVSNSLVRINGTGLSGTYYVYYQTSAGNITNSWPSSASNTQIQWSVPNNAITGVLTLVGAFGNRITPVLTITSVTPTVTGLVPNPTNPGTYVNISGSGFNNVNSIFINTSNGIQSYSFWNYTSYLQVYVPTNAITGTLTLTGNFGRQITPVLTVTSVTPTITGLTPNPTNVNTYTNIMGSGFSNVYSVFINTSNGIQSIYYTSYGSYLQASVPSNAITGTLTLSGAFGSVITPVLTVTVSAVPFFCQTNALNMGSMNITYSVQTVTAMAGAGYYWTFTGIRDSTYNFSSCGATEDTYLRIYNASGSLITSNDDVGVFCSSNAASLSFVPSSSGMYYVLFNRFSCSALNNTQNLTYYRSRNIRPVITSVSPNPNSAGNTIYLYNTGITSVNYINYRTSFGVSTAYNFYPYSGYLAGSLPSDIITGALTVVGTGGVTISPVVTITALIPNVTSISPNPTAPNNYVYIYGNNFTNVTSVRMQGSSSTLSLSFSNYGSYLLAYVPVGAITSPLTLLGSFGTVQTTTLQVVVTPSTFMCTSNNLLNRGALVFVANSATGTALSGYLNYWTFTGQAMDTYHMSTCGAYDYTYLRIYDAAGSEVAENSGYGPFCSDYYASLSFRPTVTGMYYVLLSNYYCTYLNYNTSMYYWTTSSIPPQVTSINPNPTNPASFVSIIGTNLNSVSTVQYRTNSNAIVPTTYTNYGASLIVAYIPSNAITSTLTLTGSASNVLTPVLNISSPAPAHTCITYAMSGTLTPSNATLSISLSRGIAYYYSFSAIANTTYRFSTCSNTTDTYLRLYNSAGNMEVQNNDNGVACGGQAASLDFTPSASGTYYLLVTQSTCAYLAANSSLTYSITMVNGGTPPIAAFTVSSTSLTPGSTAQFGSTSLGNPTSYSWFFEGGSPATSSLQRPLITYNIKGLYTVKLVVRNPFSADSITRFGYIKVENTTVGANLLCNESATSMSSGRLLDAGGELGSYSNNENCIFLITTSCTSGLQISFNYFATELNNDVLSVYDGVLAAPSLLLASLTGISIPKPIQTTQANVLLTFKSNASITNGGFDARWSCATINELEGPSTLHSGVTIHPNPTNTFATIQWNTLDVTQLVVYDNLGRISYQVSLINNATEMQLDVSKYQPGIYILELQGAFGRIRKKLAVE